MRTKTLDLTAIKVESFYTAGGASLSSRAEISEFTGCTECTACTEFTYFDSCGYSCQVCDTENDTDCSTNCIKATYVWETC